VFGKLYTESYINSSEELDHSLEEALKKLEEKTKETQKTVETS
jgi:hypothetical protein